MNPTYIVLYQVKSGFGNGPDGLTLNKPATDHYDILRVTLPEGYEYGLNKFDMPMVWDSRGRPCNFTRTGKYAKDGPVIAFSFGKLGEEHRYKEVELPFYEE